MLKARKSLTSPASRRCTMRVLASFGPFKGASSWPIRRPPRRRPVMPLQRPVAWARRLGNRDGDGGTGFGDGVPVVALDGVLDLDNGVPGDDRESPRVTAHGLVLGRRELDELVAAQLAAFAADGDERLAGCPTHGLIDLAQNRLTERCAPQRRFVAPPGRDIEGERH